MFRQLRRRSKAPVCRSAEQEDARALALELAGLRPEVLLDPMAFGIVVQPGEKAHRAMDLWVSQRSAHGWPSPVSCPVVVTSERLIVRMPLGGLVSLWWGSLVGFVPQLDRSALFLDYGDGFPRQITGAGIPAVTVVGVAMLYGADALATHEALECLRDRPA